MQTNSTASRVHVYCRVSSAAQEDNTSLGTQDAECRAWAAQRGLPVASATREVRSGADRHRPQLTALLDRLVSGDVVLCYALDRLSRNQNDTALLVIRIEDAGARLELVTEDFEHSATGAFLRNTKAFLAELEREKIAERTGRGKRARVAAGKPLASAKPPYGYLWADDEKSRYVLDAQTAPVVRMLFDWALAGESLSGSVARLAELGISSPSGKPRWVLPAVRDILLRSVYTGTATVYAKRSERKRGGYVRRASTPDEVVLLPNVAPPIVTPEEQAAVAARLATNKAHASRNNRNPESTLLRAGFISCGHCGYALRVTHRPPHLSGSSSQYRCDPSDSRAPDCPHPTIAASKLDNAVWQRVADVLRDPAVVAREVERRRNDGGLDRELAALDKRIASFADKQSRMARRVAEIHDDEIAAALLAEMKSIGTQKTAAERERDDVQRRIADRADEDARVRSLAE